jgi:molybdopterin converting factor small subunit
MLTKNDLSSIRKLVKGEVQGSEKKLGAKMQAVEKSLSSKINKVQESVDVVHAVVVEHYGKLEKRVAVIEEELNIPKNL